MDLAMSSPCTSGRHGVPSLFIAIFLVVQASPARLFSTMSNRCRTEGDLAAGEHLADRLGDLADLVVLLVAAHVEGLVVDRLARRGQRALDRQPDLQRG